MKCKKKLKALLFIFFTVLIVISINQFPIMNNMNFRKNKDEIPSTSPVMTEGIFINGSATGVGANNWTWVQYQPWFGGGTGSWKDPFILEDLIFNHTNEDYTIEIINSDVYFEIRNCTFLESSRHGEFYLRNVNNSRIINNELSQSNGIQIYDCNTAFILNNSLDAFWYGDHGLRVSNCDNITIFHNSFSAFARGINVIFGNNISISNNTIYDCGDYGVNLYDCNHVNIIENYLTQNDHGIRISDSDDVKLRKNNLKDPNNYKAEIYISNSNNTSIIENEIEDHYIRLNGDKNTICSTKMKENVINGKPLISYMHEKNLVSSNFSKDCEVFLINCSHSSFLDLKPSKGGIGISLYYCTNITMQNFTSNKNIGDGFYVQGCTNITMQNISSNENIGDGFHVQGCTNITMENSSFSYNEEDGIYILYSRQVDIINNEINFNYWHGIVLRDTDYCLIEYNTIKGHYYYGLFIDGSWYNKIYFNIILDNYIKGIYQMDSDHNEFFGNICDDNEEELFLMNPLMCVVVSFVLFIGIFFLISTIRNMNDKFKRELKYIIEKAKR